MKIIKMIGVLVISTVISSCGERNEIEQNSNIETETVVYKKISAEEAKNIMDTKEGVTILDVRNEDEYEEGHIPNSTLLPLYDLETEIETVVENKDYTILIYCRSGRRSALAANILIDLGYTDVYDFGGIINWPYDVVE